MGKLKKHLDEVVNPLWNAAEKCKTPNDHLLNAVLGLAGEAGEVADTVKKILYHKDQPGRIDDLKLELGDVMYYWLKTMDLLSLSVGEVLKANREKLFERYADKVPR